MSLGFNKAVPSDHAKNLVPGEGEVFLYPGFYSAGESGQFFKRFRADIPWQQQPIKIFGKEVMQPRLTACYGDPGTSYTYSGLTMQALPWTRELLEIKKKVEEFSQHTFNSALLNLYRNGSDSMGWHRDNEKELGIDPVIASVSFGATRKFQLRRYDRKKEKISIDLTTGCLLIMSGSTQHNWEHAVPKTALLVGERINLTFRDLK